MRRRVTVGLAVAVALGAGVAAWIAMRPGAPSTTEAEAPNVVGSPTPPPALAAQPRAAEGAPVPKGTQDETGTSPSGAPEAAGAGKPLAAIRVVVTGEGKPIEGARVRVRLQGDDHRPLFAAISDATGIVTIDPVVVAAQIADRKVADGYAVRFEVIAAGFRMGSSDGTDLMDDTLEIELLRGVAFDGRVVDAATSVPIAGASVVVRDWTDDFEVGPTDEHGVFHVTGVMDDHEAALTARAKGRATGHESVRIDGGKPPAAAVVVRLQAGGAIAGTVRDPDGAPVAGAVVRLEPQAELVSEPDPEEEPAEDPDPTERYEYDDRILEDDWMRPSERYVATAGADGSFRVDGLPLGADLEATATARGFAASVPTRDLRASSGAADRAVTITMRRAANLVVRVAVPAGEEVPSEARVRVFLLPRDVMRKPTGKGVGGRYEFRDLEPGRARVFVQAEGYRSAVTEVRLTDGVALETRVALEAGGTVEGTVVDVDGNPISNARVTVGPAARNTQGSGRHLRGGRKATTDDQGRFSIGGVTPGAAILVAEWRDFGPNRFLGTQGRVPVACPSQGTRVVLKRFGSARMRILALDGRPFTGQGWTYVLYPSGGWGGSGDGIEKGRIESGPLADGKHGLLVMPEGYAWIARSFTIRGGADVDFGDVVLDPGLTVSGRVVDGRGAPIQNVAIHCEENVHRSVRTDAEGRFSFDRFPRESVTFGLRAEGFGPGRLDVHPAKTVGLEVRLGRFARIRGVVKGHEGGPQTGTLELRVPDAEERHVPATSLDGKPVDYAYYEGSEVFAADAEGRFEGEIAPGRFIGWWSSRPGELRMVGEWTFADGETRELEIVLPAK